ncbi:MAG: hypothetical protein OXH53_11055 [bacterium]|nr:hypothetical protein [bacterium]
MTPEQADMIRRIGYTEVAEDGLSPTDRATVDGLVDAGLVWRPPPSRAGGTVWRLTRFGKLEPAGQADPDGDDTGLALSWRGESALARLEAETGVTGFNVLPER